MNPFNYKTTESSLLLDSEGKILDANPTAIEMIGLSKEEILGRPCYEVIEGRDPAGNLFCFESCAVMTMAKRKEPVNNYEIQMTTRDGRKQRLNVSTLVESGLEADGHPKIVHIFRPAASFLREWNGPHRKNGSDDKVRKSDGLSELAKRFSLAKREAEVLDLTACGLGAKEIGVRLGLATATVRTYVQRVLKKMGVRSKLEAVALICRQKKH